MEINRKTKTKVTAVCLIMVLTVMSLLTACVSQSEPEGSAPLVK